MQWQVTSCYDWHEYKFNLIYIYIYIYIYFIKAFDSAVHCKLLHKLKCYGFNGLLLDWIVFFTNRRQMIRVGSSLSHAGNVISGVPKAVFWGRCCLSFILMTYIKSRVLLKMMLPFNCLPMTSRCIKNVESAIMLQHWLDLICNWATSWQLKLSPSKCTVLSLGKAHVTSLFHCCDAVLPIVNQMTDLCILIDYQLSFSPHIDTVCIKAKQRAALILNCFYSRHQYLLIRVLLLTLGHYLKIAVRFGCHRSLVLSIN